MSQKARRKQRYIDEESFGLLLCTGGAPNGASLLPSAVRKSDLILYQRQQRRTAI